MPAILVHNSFALENAEGIEKKYLDATRLGSQGPDPFFFYGILRFGKHSHKSLVRKFGSALHKRDISEDYFELIKFAKEEKRDADLLLSYIDGLFMHFCVDKVFHPYVFYRTGFNPDGTLKGYYSYTHSLFESILDVEFSKKENTYCRPSKCLNIDKKQLLKISKLWSKLPYGLKEKDFYYATKDYKKVERFVNGGTEVRRFIFLIGGRRGILRAISYPRHLKNYKVYDVENTKKITWKHPATGELSNYNVEELFIEASAEFKKIRDIIHSDLDEQNLLLEIRKFVNNTCHDGLKVGDKKQYFDNCFKK
ncbi:MAG: hypothetical protein SPL02_02320 [Bacilli bacterium]|nr:hypothetical protein [Bacilli bacterium]MDY6430168.1 hypothetical protein [Bacilli bacterium]